jgi:high mobility group protein B2
MSLGRRDMLECLNIVLYRSAFFCFCNEERAKVKAKNPGLSVGEIAKELGKRWEVCPNKSKFEEIAGKDKQRYERVIYLNLS